MSTRAAVFVAIRLTTLGEGGLPQKQQNKCPDLMLAHSFVVAFEEPHSQNVRHDPKPHDGPCQDINGALFLLVKPPGLDFKRKRINDVPQGDSMFFHSTTKALLLWFCCNDIKLAQSLDKSNQQVSERGDERYYKFF